VRIGKVKETTAAVTRSTPTRDAPSTHSRGGDDFLVVVRESGFENHRVAIIPERRGERLSSRREAFAERRATFQQRLAVRRSPRLDDFVYTKSSFF